MRNGIKYNWTELRLLAEGKSQAFTLIAFGFIFEERTVKTMETKIELPKLEDFKWTPGGVVVVHMPTHSLDRALWEKMTSLPDGPAMVLFLPPGAEVSSLTTDQFEQIRKAQEKSGQFVKMCMKCHGIGKPQRLCDGYEPSRGFVKDGYCPIHGFARDWTGEARPTGVWRDLTPEEAAKHPPIGTPDGGQLVPKIADAKKLLIRCPSRPTTVPIKYASANWSLPTSRILICVTEPDRIGPDIYVGSGDVVTRDGIVVLTNIHWHHNSADYRPGWFIKAITEGASKLVGVRLTYEEDKHCLRCGREFGERDVNKMVSILNGPDGFMRIQCEGGCPEPWPKTVPIKYASSYWSLPRRRLEIVVTEDERVDHAPYVGSGLVAVRDGAVVLEDISWYGDHDKPPRYRPGYIIKAIVDASGNQLIGVRLTYRDSAISTADDT